jgi:lysophospholipase
MRYPAMLNRSPSTGTVPDARYAFYNLTDGARLRYAIFDPAGTPCGTFLVLAGRREFIEKKAIEVGSDLLARGYRIILFDWRGSGLSSRLLSGARRQCDHATDLDIFVEDLRALIRDVVRPRQTGPFFIFAHSLGALLGARWLMEGKDVPPIKAVILTAPALALGVPFFSRAISRIFVKLGLGERYAAAQHDYDDRDRRFERNVLSHDRARFMVIEKYFDANPELRVGGVSWGWLAAALKAIRQLEQPGALEGITMPVLGLFAGKDIVTPPSKTIPLLRRMPRAEAVLIRGARHDLMNEEDRYRFDAWRHIDLFLKRVTRA